MARFAGRYKTGAHRQAALNQAGDYMVAGVTVTIDVREVVKLQSALRDAGVGIEKSKKVLSQSLNRAGKRIETRLVKALQRWTGVKTQARIRQDLRPVIATPGNMRAGVIASGRHMRVTSKNFGARWRRSWSGGRHRAWGRAQTADGSFMIHNNLLMTRTSSERLPIVPLWGPSVPREVQRHAPFVRAIVNQQARWFMREAERRVDVEFKRVKAKYGL